MTRHDDPQPPHRRRHRRLAGLALGSAVLLVTGLFQPLPLSFGPAHADDHITGPLQDAIERDADDVGDSIDAANAALAALTANAGTFATQLQTILSTAPSDPSGALTALGAALGGEAGSLASTGLTQALTLASEVAAPTCSTLGALTAILPSVGLSGVLDSILGPLAGPVDQLENKLSDAVLNYYTAAFTKLLTPVALPGGAAALQPYVTLAQDLLALLKMNWHTTYYPPNGGAPIVRDTPGFLDLPTPIDVDGRVGADVCGLTNYNTSTKAISQSISRLPLTAAFPLDISGQFLDNLIGAGYSTKGSAAPASFQTTIAAGGGTGLAITADSTQFGAGPTFTQTLNLSSAIQLALASTKAPSKYHFATSAPGGSGTSNLQIDYTGSAPSTKFAFTASLGALNLGIAETPGATSFEFCTAANGACSNEAAATTATEKDSMHFVANQPVTVDQTSTAGSTTCPTILGAPLALFDAHLTGTSLYLGHNPTAAAGHVWVDTGNRPVSGCLGTASSAGTIPSGFLAKARSVSWSGTGNPVPATAKTGTITCPTGTKVISGSFDLDRYFCSLPPTFVLGNPNITATGSHFDVGQTLTANLTSGPGAPNLPGLTYSWFRCDPNGNSCTAIPNTNAGTYTPVSTATDQGKTFKFSVTGVNLDAPAGVTVTSAATPAIGAPIAPTNSVKPVISGSRTVGAQLTPTTGTWDQSPLTYSDQWQRCNQDGTGCVNILGAAGPAPFNYPPTSTDQQCTTGAGVQGCQLQVVVKATNQYGAFATATSNQLYIPPAPTNVTPPVIADGNNSTAPVAVLQGDKLTVINPTAGWNYAQSFTYQWYSCTTNTDLSNCTKVSTDSTGLTYTPPASDVHNYLTVTVTGNNPNGSTPAIRAAFTSAVVGNPYVVSAPNPNSVPDGAIYASTPSTAGDYIGGSFDTIGPRVGGGGAVPGNATTEPTSYPAALQAMVSGGTVNAVASDGLGGYFLGGSFTSAGTPATACPGIAHITKTGALDSTYCQSGLVGTVKALDYVNANLKISSSTAAPVNLLAVGGGFSDGANSNLILIDSTGKVSAPVNEPTGPSGLGGSVNSIADDSSIAALTAGTLNFFAGGAFTQLGTTAAKNLMTMTVSQPQTLGTAVPVTSSTYPGGVDCASTASGAIPCGNPVINAVSWLTTALTTPELVFGGTFNNYYLPTSTGTASTGTTRNNAAAIYEPLAGQASILPTAVGNWNPSPNGPVTAINGVLLTGTVYLAGNFTTVTNGATNYPVNGLVEYGIGTTTTGGVTNNNANTANTAVTSSPNTSWTPSTNGQVNAILSADSGVYLGGSFTSVTIGTTTTVRHRLAHIKAAAAIAPTLDGWDPNAGQAVRSLARFATGPMIFVGGDFQVLGGTTRNHLAEMTKTNGGTLTTWAPAGTTAPVRALATTSGTVYAGGDVPATGANLYAFDNTSGNSLWSVAADGTVRALTVGTGGLYLGGSFTHVGTGPGNARAHLAAVALSTGVLGPWSPSFTGSTVNALVATAGALYVGGSSLTAFDPTTAVATGWNPAGITGTVNALALTGSGVYVGGSFTVSGGPPNAAEFDLAGNLVAGWVPSIPSSNNTVRTLALIGSTVLIGGDFGAIQVNGSDGSTPTGAFAPSPNGPVYSISVSNGLIGIFGSFTNISGNPTNGYGFYGG